MSGITFFTSERVKRKKQNIVPLKKYHEVDSVPEYYTYTDEDGSEKRYSGIISKVGDHYIGKRVIRERIGLVKHDGLESVVGVPEHYTYVDEDGTVQQYYGDVQDNGDGTFTGKLKTVEYHDEPVQVFED